MVVAYVAFGSNVGDRAQWIHRALRLLETEPGISVKGVSRIVETKPLGPQNQGDYLNGVAKIETRHSPVVLLDHLLGIEQRLGRKRTVRWGPRTIDLDVLHYDNRVIDHSRIRIPHPELPHRPFLLESIRELHGPIQRY